MLITRAENSWKIKRYVVNKIIITYNEKEERKENGKKRNGKKFRRL